MQRKIAKTALEQRRMAKAYGLYAVALTLTYKPSENPSGKDISRFLDKLRRKLKGLGIPLLYTWVLERQEAFHYHLQIWLPRGERLDAKSRERWWPHGRTQAELCRSPARWARYLSKSETKESLPPGVRFFGTGGLDDRGQETVRRACLPRWLQRELPVFARPRRRRGGGWVDILTGELYRSPYVWKPEGITRRPPEP
ncbi:rolling circle replication-associated protein [Diaphorobacter nitroreducens]|uniref:rolling circle replication-associated protein n=1 Tax=Diaphorobacter nitroreducens TaxID=164759 RepID=UPI002897B021|nr:hypothetical protein [Diaphorobacter nitroreducens]